MFQVAHNPSQPGSSGQPRRWRGRDPKQPSVREVENPDDYATALHGRFEKLEEGDRSVGADNPEAKKVWSLC